MSPKDIGRSSSPSSGWRGRLIPRRQSQERPQVPAKEVSRWSKTTTESELSEAGLAPASKRRTFLKKTKERKKSKDTAKSSPTDPFYDPITKELQPYAGDIPLILTTSRPDNTMKPSTFLDDASDDGEVDSPTSPVIQRASSVRVSRPQVIQHSNSSAASVPKLYPPQNTPSSLNDVTSASDTHITLGEDLFIRLTPAIEKSEQDAVSGGPNDALKSLEGATEATDDITALPQIPTDANVERPHTLRETIVSWPDTPSRLEALDTMPTPMGGFGSMRIPRSSNGTFATDSTATYVSPSIMTDGLRSNPASDNEKVLSRAISAPVRNSRRVMIRPADLVISKTGHDHKLFRENIVSTPYPARKSSHVEIEDLWNASVAEEAKEEHPAKKPRKLRRSRPLSHIAQSSPDDKTTDITEKVHLAPEVPLATKPTLAAPRPATAISDRFPSPSAPEILFLDLYLARHPSARVSVEIEIKDKSTFDDEALFGVVRKAYIEKLMGRARWAFCARTLESASLNPVGEASIAPHPRTGFRPGHHVPAGNGNDFDTADFTAHIHNPRLGHRRKQWLLWLCNAQHADTYRGRRSHLPQISQTHATPSPSDEKTESPVFSFMQHSRNNSSDASPLQEYRGVVSHSKQPSLSNPNVLPLPRMPFTSPPAQGQQPGLTSFHRSKSLALCSTYPAPYVSTGTTHGPPKIYLTHTFSLPSIALFTFLTLLMAIFTATMWILFGVPGRSAASGDGVATVSGQDFPVPWRRDAAGRVGVGLVMGVMVLLVGGLCEVAWVWGSWVLV